MVSQVIGAFAGILLGIAILLVGTKAGRLELWWQFDKLGWRVMEIAIRFHEWRGKRKWKSSM